MEQHPTKNELYDIYLAHHPTEQELETYKANWNYVSSFESMLEVTELKLEAAKAVPTVLEETMSVVQLFESGSPLWARPYSISELCFIIPMRESISDEVFIQLLQQASNYDTLARGLIEAL
jgi:hypothetical protein